MLDRRMGGLAAVGGGLAGAPALQRALVDCTLVGPSPTRRIVLPEPRARDKLARGMPLLHAEDVYLDARFLRDLFDRLLGAMRARPDLARQADALSDAVHRHHFHVEHAVAEALANHPEHVEQLAVEAGLDAELVATLFDLCARPVLRAYAEQLVRVVRSSDWVHGYCPVCGAWAGLVELLAGGRGRDRLLRCPRCGVAWPASRCGCPFCSSDDIESLHVEAPRSARVLSQNESELAWAGWWVQGCRACRGYLKAREIDVPFQWEALALAELATTALDAAARERGYVRPPEPGFRLELLGAEGDDYDD
ncbi:MAG TPA: formate dehydrogenase accessory protein FdhE [Chloroflexota bacterium]|nr:formate dehydrogenase accessory protein FdhE [Chloroflexota bacterium]